MFMEAINNVSVLVKLGLQPLHSLKIDISNKRQMEMGVGFAVLSDK